MANSFPDIPDAQLIQLEKELVRDKCLEDIFFLAKEIFPHHFTSPTPDFHKEIVRNVLKEGLVEKKRKLFVCISVSHDKAKELYTIPLKREFESNPALIKYFSDVRPSGKWTEDELEFTNGVKVVAKGRGQAIRGTKFISQRPNVILIDDLEDEESVNTQEQRQITQNWFDFDVTEALSVEDKHHIAIAAPRGFGKSTIFLLVLCYLILFPQRVTQSLLAFIGTILHDDSMLNKLIAKKAEYKDKYGHWKDLKFKALVDGKSLWQERHPASQLEEEKRKDLYRFSREKQNEPIPIGAGMFKSEYFKTWETLPAQANYYLTVDLACTDKEYSDFTVIMVTCVDPTNTIYVVEYTRKRYVDPDDTINEIFRLSDKYPNVKSIGVEGVSFQRFLIVNFLKAQKARPLSAKRYGICELKADRDKTRRISELQPWFATGQILIRHNMVDLQEELLMFPKASHDDVADALAYVIQRGFITAPDPAPEPKQDIEGTFFQAKEAIKKFNKLRGNKSNKRFSSEELYMRAIGWR